MIVLVVLAAATERLTETVLAAAGPLLGEDVRRVVPLAVSLVVGFGLALLTGDLVSPVLGAELGGGAGVVVTGMVLAGVAGPVHELVRWLEEAKAAKARGG
ncbi:MAG TPA: hypothetical protein VII57_05935 [Dehalococcoidia bacterium]